jgi:hypothetical protein
MRLAQAYARFLGAAVVLIALYLMPSVALAHGSHAHPGAQVATLADSHQPRAEAKTGAVAPKIGAVVSQARLAQPDTGGESPVCVMGCCALGSGCCPGVLAVVADPPSTMAPPSRLAVVLDAAGKNGIDPEALRKPPKILV